MNWVLINDADRFGVTVHYIDLGIDTGDIITQKTSPITDEDDYASLLERATHLCAETLYEALCLIEDGTHQEFRKIKFILLAFIVQEELKVMKLLIGIGLLESF